jgi:NTE family protein
MGGTALVLGGGGVTGIAWELGLLAGLAEAGVDLTRADLVVGTSAGSVVGAIVTSGEPLERAYERQLGLPPATVPTQSQRGAPEKSARVGLGLVLSYARAALERDEQRGRARIGAMALAARTVPEQERRDIIAARLAGADWPTAQRLLVTAVAADDGEFVVFGSDSGVSLADAVAASCAVPGVWPPVTISVPGHPTGVRRYIDGGTRAPANVDLAAGASNVVVLAPISIAMRRSMRVEAQVAALPPGTRSVVVTPDGAARRAIGRNVLDPARRAPSARAGRAQAASVVAAVRAVWPA